ncbi:DMT family transporter [Nakamurella aerolata]|uniref:DMT family transporter n=1 Tax=Nakamurella aerolata TaxID=1656892 RepID=A0A849A3T9_9ACTN|nr:DMT family transporter [Nakamurella aerolata]NNG35225.1 DMT family transporter [Nakamurella aerolata]
MTNTVNGAGAPTTAAAPVATQRGRLVLGALLGAAAMTLVGGSIAASRVLADAPSLTAQAVRYALATALLAGYAKLRRVPLRRPRGWQWAWLLAVSGCGLVVFNLALMAGSRHAEPAVFGVAMAAVPVLLALLGPVLEHRAPTVRAVLGALVVTAGAALVEGFGRTDAVGLLLAVTVFVCEAAFTLCAVPVLAQHGAVGVSWHACWIATVAFGVGGVWREGPTAVLRFTSGEWAAVIYMAVGVTAVAFVCWYTGVRLLGSDRAGLLTGVAPVAAIGAGMLLGDAAPAPAVWLGIAVVAMGLTIGLRAGRRRAGRVPVAPAVE